LPDVILAISVTTSTVQSSRKYGHQLDHIGGQLNFRCARYFGIVIDQADLDVQQPTPFEDQFTAEPPQSILMREHQMIELTSRQQPQELAQTLLANDPGCSFSGSGIST
jgi:hypothetical protein